MMDDLQVILEGSFSPFTALNGMQTKRDLLYDARVFPAYLSGFSLLIAVIQLSLEYRTRSRAKDNEKVQYPHTKSYNTSFRIIESLRSLSCFVLVGISAVMARQSWRADSIVYWFLLATFGYTALLSLFTVVVVGRSGSFLSLHVSAIHFLTLAIFTYRDLLPLTTANSPLDPSPQHWLWGMYGVLAFTGFVIPCALPSYFEPKNSENSEIPNPSQVAGLFSYLFYVYLDPLVRLAYKKSNLTIEDLPPIRRKEHADFLKATAFPIMDPYSSDKKRSLILGIVKYFRKEFFYMLLCMIVQVINTFAGPIATLRILSYLEATDRHGLTRPWIWIVWLALGPIFSSIAIQLQVYFKTHMNVRMEVIFTQLIFDHAIRVRLYTASPELPKKEEKKEKDTKKDNAEGANDVTPASNGDNRPDGSTSGSSTAVESRSESPQPDPPKTSPSKEVSNQAGGINNLLTVDMGNITRATEVQGITSVFRLISCFFLLYDILGWSTFVGAAILVISLPVPGYFVKVRRTIQKTKMQKSDARLQAVTQAMNVLRMIKFFGWESQIENKIRVAREAELRYVWWSDILDTGSHVIVGLFPLAAMIGTYACFTLIMNRPLNASLIFSSIALFDLLKRQLIMLTWYIPMYIKGKVSIDRLSTFLNGGERLASVETSQEEIATGEQPEIYIRNAEFTWDSKVENNVESGRRKFKLRIEDEVRFVGGKVNLIAGPTGSGKTTMLMTLLGELIANPLSPRGGFKLPREEGVAYAAQESWVMNETIKENILFGAAYDEQRYQKVIHQTALDKDLSLFEAGDLTEVGEKGITLSGGQKARITLARAVYSKAQIVLLDDILSALDVHTARWIVDECLSGDLLGGRTVLLVTHNVLLAQSVAHHVVSLSLDGTVHSSGAIEDVLREDAALRAAASEKLKESETSAKEAGADSLEEDNKAAKGKLIVAEEAAIGHVGWPAFKLYLTSLGGPFFYVSAIGSLVIAALVPIVQKWFLAYWAGQYELYPIDQVPVKKYLIIYSIMAIVGSCLSVSSWIVYLFGIIRASRLIHQSLIHSVMTSTLRWLDTTPVSRVITRCSQDTEAVDDTISGTLNAVVALTISIIITSITVVAVSGWEMLILSITIITGGLVLGHVYMTAQLPVKRLMSNAKSPIVSHVQTALVGLVSVRAYGAQQTFQAEMRRRMDTYSTIAHPYWDLNRWIAVRIEVIGGVFSGVLGTWLVYGRSSSPGIIGFTLVLISSFNAMLLHWVRIFNELEVQGNSLERIRDYIAIEHEPEATEDGKPPAYWPASGELVVKDLSARYSQDGPEVLKDITFTVKSGERVGVVGRTGAGKSTLGLALLRAVPTTGTVLYDGKDTAALNLEALRSNLSIIPQSPDLLAGTLRENLDPLGEHDDAVLNEALNSAGLSHLKTDDGKDGHGIGLDSKVESGGSNFSQGQRQIIALARAFVRRTKVLIMDEATAAIDYKTDHLIQQFIRSEFKEVTVITVAHRLQTIMDSDKILVLDAGRLAEWGSPKELLAREAGAFKSLVDGSADKEELYAVARA